MVALTMVAAGVVWIATGLAPLFGGHFATALARLSLVPTALVVIAVGSVVAGARMARALWVVVVSASAIAAIGAAGAFRFSMAAFGLCLLAWSFSLRHGDSSRVGRSAISRDRSPAAWVGAGLLAVGLCSSFGLWSAAFVTNLHELVILVGSAVVAWYVLESHPSGGDPVLGALTGALSDALGRDVVTIAFPPVVGESRFVDAEVAWLDPAGVECRPFDAGAPVFSRDGVAVAWLAPPIEGRECGADLLRLLDVAGDVARLRADLCARAAEIERSTQRLATAADGERARLAVMLESGPLRSLGRVAELVGRAAPGVDLHQRIDAAERALRDVVNGTEPIDPGDGLKIALQQLAERSGATWEIDDAADGLSLEAARLVWFSCAEGLANAAKHAVGAPVSLTLTCQNQGFELRVVDRGGGGADGNGPGLSRLAERAAESGATLTVESPVGRGTCVTVAGPSSMRQTTPGEVPALMTRADPVGTMPT